MTPSFVFTRVKFYNAERNSIEFWMKSYFNNTENPEKYRKGAQTPKCTGGETVNAIVFKRTAW